MDARTFPIRGIVRTEPQTSFNVTSEVIAREMPSLQVLLYLRNTENLHQLVNMVSLLLNETTANKKFLWETHSNSRKSMH